MPHFFINSKDKNDKTIKISDAENYRHIARALRARIGEKLLLIDENQIQYETEINKIDSREIFCKIIKEYKSKRDLEFDLFLAQSPLRSDAQLTIMEKATELGARTVIPILTDNCTLNKDVAIKKQEKWQKVMYEASKQCERAIIPTCEVPTTLEEVTQRNFDRIIVFVERLAKQSLKEVLNKKPIQKDEKILAIIGPEGGFSQKEFDYFEKNNFIMVSLGDLILKAETAVIVALGDIIYEYRR